MNNITTLNKINRSDIDFVGFKAVDLAELNSKKILIPISFVINSSLMDDFISRNGFENQIRDILSRIDYTSHPSLEEAYSLIKDLFNKATFTNDEESELVEAYETLAIDMDHINIAKLVTSIDKPFLTFITSPNYVDDSESNRGIFQNIKGKNQLLNAIKNCWISLYTPSALEFRKKNNITGDIKAGIIVQRMMEAEISAQSYSDEEEIVVKAYIGYQDFDDEFNKDVMVFSKGSLNIKNNKTNFQELSYTRDSRDNTLVKKKLRDEGGKQKLNDKEGEELARITKRIESYLERPVKAFFCMSKQKAYLLFANKIIRKNPEVEEMTISENSDSQEKASQEISKPQENTIDNSNNKELNTKNNTEEDKTDIKIKEHEEPPLEEDIKFLDEIERIEKEIDSIPEEENNNQNNEANKADEVNFEKEEPLIQNETYENPDIKQEENKKTIDNNTDWTKEQAISTKDFEDKKEFQEEKVQDFTSDVNEERELKDSQAQKPETLVESNMQSKEENNEEERVLPDELAPPVIENERENESKETNYTENEYQGREVKEEQKEEKQDFNQENPEEEHLMGPEQLQKTEEEENKSDLEPIEEKTKEIIENYSIDKSDQEDEEPITDDFAKDNAQNQIKEESEDDTLKLDDEDDDFIFAGMSEPKEDKTRQKEENLESQQSNKDIEPKEYEEDDWTKSEEEVPKEVSLENKEQESITEDKFQIALNKIKELVILCDDAIIDALDKKQKYLDGKTYPEFNDKIYHLKEKVKVPFVDEIKKVHKIREKLENGEEVDIEESNMAIRTVKNFLSVFD